MRLMAPLWSKNRLLRPKFQVYLRPVTSSMANIVRPSLPPVWAPRLLSRRRLPSLKAHSFDLSFSNGRITHMATIDVTDQDFQETVIDSDKTDIVASWADWVWPCRQ